MMVYIEWLQLMCVVRDRVRGRAPLLLVFSGALLLVMGGWPDRCTAMPKGMLPLNRSVECAEDVLPEVPVKVGSADHDLQSVRRSEIDGGGGWAEGRKHTRTEEVSWSFSEQVFGGITRGVNEVDRSALGGGRGVGDEARSGGGSGAVNSGERILSRSDRSVSSINSSASPPPTKIRLRHRMHSASRNSNNSISRRLSSASSSNNNNRTKSGSNLERNERSANLSHSNAKIQLYIKNRLLQILPDGTVNGTQDDSSDYTILQRTAVDVGKIKIQSIATCMFLCMDACGNPFASKHYTDDCIFNEAMELHHYNTYSSAKHSNSRRILYLALNRHGQTRKIHIPITRSLGKLSTYTNALTHPVDETMTTALLAKLFGPNHVRHGLKQLCETPKVHLRPLTVTELIPRPKCLMGEKATGGPKKISSTSLQGPLVAGKKGAVTAAGGPKRKNGKKCREDQDAGDCTRPTPMQVLTRKKGNAQKQQPTKCAGGEDNCSGPKKGGPKRKLINSNTNQNNGKRKKMMTNNARTTTAIPTTTTTAEDLDTDEDNGGGLDPLEDPALADDPTIYYHHINRLQSSASLQMDEEDADFD